MKDPPHSRRCRRSAVFLGACALCLLGCADSAPAPRLSPPPAAAEPGVATAPSAGAPLVGQQAVTRFYSSYLAEHLEGDFAAARTGYQDVVADKRAAPATVARAALRLAALEVAGGSRERANDLTARALALAGDDAELLLRADRLRARTAVTGTATPGRGPVPGTEIEGTPQDVAAMFARAEGQMEVYFRRPLAPRIEGLSGALRNNKAALDGVVRLYREVGEKDPAVKVAASFRIGALYHNSALAMFAVPPELEPGAAAQLRRTLRRRALGYLARAHQAYTDAVQAAEALDGDRAAAARRWRLAAESGLVAVDELLRGRE